VVPRNLFLRTILPSSMLLRTKYPQNGYRAKKPEEYIKYYRPCQAERAGKIGRISRRGEDKSYKTNRTKKNGTYKTYMSYN